MSRVFKVRLVNNHGKTVAVTSLRSVAPCTVHDRIQAAERIVDDLLPALPSRQSEVVFDLAKSLRECVSRALLQVTDEADGVIHARSTVLGLNLEIERDVEMAAAA